MAIALVSHISLGAGQDGGTTTGIDTTGSSLLIASIEGHFPSSANDPTLSDSKGNTWAKLTGSYDGVAGFGTVSYYCLVPTVGTGHTFTFTSNPTGTGCFPCCQVSAWSGVSAFDKQGASTGSSAVTATVTPAQNGALVYTAFSNNTNSITSVSSPFTTIDINQLTGGTNYAGANAYFIQTTIAGISATWATATGIESCDIFIFVPSGGGGTVEIDLVKSDTLSLSDSIVEFLTSTQITLSEALTLADQLSIGLNLPVGLVDSLSFSDAFVDLIGIGLNLNDTLSLADFLAVYFILARQFNDNLLFSDALNAVLADNPAYSDTLTFTDAAKLQLSLGLSFNDNLALLDSLQLRLSTNIQLLVASDTLTLSDALELVLSGDLDSYIRHYLNDVPN